MGIHGVSKVNPIDIEKQQPQEQKSSWGRRFWNQIQPVANAGLSNTKVYAAGGSCATMLFLVGSLTWGLGQTATLVTVGKTLVSMGGATVGLGCCWKVRLIPVCMGFAISQLQQKNAAEAGKTTDTKGRNLIDENLEKLKETVEDPDHLEYDVEAELGAAAMQNVPYAAFIQPKGHLSENNGFASESDYDEQ